MVKRAERDCQGIYCSVSCTTVGDLKSVERNIRMMVTFGLMMGGLLKSRVQRCEGMILERTWLRVVKVRG